MSFMCWMRIHDVGYYTDNVSWSILYIKYYMYTWHLLGNIIFLLLDLSLHLLSNDLSFLYYVKYINFHLFLYGYPFIPEPLFWNVEARCWNWRSNTLATWCEELIHWKRPWCWERLRAGGEGDDRGWDGWIASPTQWTWVWVDFRIWWGTGRPGMLCFMESQRVGHDWATELNWTRTIIMPCYS